MNLEHIVPISIVLIILGSILAAFFTEPLTFKQSRTYVFASIAASVAVVIFALNVLLNTTALEFQKSINTAQFTKQAVDKLWVYPNQVLAEKTKVRPEFSASMYYNNLELYQLTKNINTKPTAESELEEQFVSILFIQCFEDYMTIRKFDETGDAVWLVNFLQWAQSPYLKANFDRLKYNFAPLTISFTNLLFEYAKKAPIPTKDPETYNKLAAEIQKDPKLIAIYKERSKL